MLVLSPGPQIESHQVLMCCKEERITQMFKIVLRRRQGTPSMMALNLESTLFVRIQVFSAWASPVS